MSARGERITLDVMGGDQAPEATIGGALRATKRDDGRALSPERIVLVGDEATILAELEKQGGNPGFEIVHASQAIGMDESPSKAMRAKPDSSIARCIAAAKQGDAGAIVSMGNTGAVVGASTLMLKTLEGVRRPGISVTLNLTGNPVTIMDMGANIAPKPEHLYQYAVMASVYARDVLGIESPRVALLNVGEEASKGTDLLKETHTLLAESDLQFVGNLEGGDIFKGCADVLVTDGFTGNVVLKLLESFSEFMLKLMMGELGKKGIQLGADDVAGVVKNIDYSEYGGALLLGVNGAVVIGHGRSDARAVANALELAASTLDAGVNADIVQGLERMRASAAQSEGGASS